MAFLVLTLSLVPCADKGMTKYEGKVKTEITKSTQQKGDPKQDDCSPFCHCTCCAGFSNSHLIANYTSLSLISPRVFSSYLPDNLIEISLPIWQPPKI